MEAEKYKFGIFDAQIILVTNWNFLKARGWLDESKLLTLFTQTIIKNIKTVINCEKVFLCWDTKPYHRAGLVPWQKADRFHYTDEFVESYRALKPVSDEESHNKLMEIISESQGRPQEEIDEAVNTWKETHPSRSEYENTLALYEQELEYEHIKERVKKTIIKELSNIGMISLSYQGWEADDLALLYAQLLEKDDDTSIIVSKDSDWEYLLNPNINLLRYHRGEIYSYQQIYDTLPEEARRRGVGLYEYKAIVDSLYGSHNNYQNCAKNDYPFNWDEFLNGMVENGRTGSIDTLEKYCDTDIFLPQFKSFFIENYQDFHAVKDEVNNLLHNKCGSIYQVEEVKHFTNRVGLNISQNYYQGYYDILNKDRYTPGEHVGHINIDEIFDAL